MRAGLLLLRKDLRLVGRSRAVLLVLLLYPLALAALVGTVVDHAGSRTRVALVDEDHVPDVVRFQGERFDFRSIVDGVSTDVDLVEMDRDEARRALERGEIAATIVIPQGFLAQLRSLLVSPKLVLETNQNALRDRVVREAQSLVYDLNRRLQNAYIAQNVDYLNVLVHGGSVRFLGRDIDLLGLNPSRDLIANARAALPPGSKEVEDLDRVDRFANQATLALGQAQASLEATAHPIVLEEARVAGRRALLGPQLQSYALAVSLVFAGILLAAGALALEREENVLGRLERGLVPLGALVAEKIALVALIALGLGVLLVLGFAVAVALADGAGPSWARLPLLVPALLAAGAAIGAVGALLGAIARDLRTATVLTLAVTIPAIFLGIVPAALSPAAARISDLFPFAPAVDAFHAILFAGDGLDGLGLAIVHLLVLALVYGALTRVAVTRLRT